MLRLHAIPKTGGVEYFTTYPHWNPDKLLRHRQYVMAQESEGVKVTFGHYKEKQVECKATCKARFTIWQEKQTDVNIAVRLVELARQNVIRQSHHHFRRF